MRFELTFPDDTMEGLSQEEKGLKGAIILHRWQTWVERNDPGLVLIWKREWEPRRSGKLASQLIPHYHFLMYRPRFTKDEYLELWSKIAIRWVRTTHTQDANAYSVALHNRSRGFLRPGDEYVNYFGKYITKGRFESGEGVGRFWGITGPLAQAEGETIDLNDHQVVILKRILRRYLKSTQKRSKKLPDGSKIKVKPKRRYEKRLRNGSYEGFVAIRCNTLQRIINSVKDKRVS